MDTLARVIAVLISIEGLIALFFPGTAGAAAESFRLADKSSKRIAGAVSAAAGSLIFYLTRAYLSRTLPHWVIAVSGIYLMLFGGFLILIPEQAGRIPAWFYRDKGPASLAGAILLAAGITIYILL